MSKQDIQESRMGGYKSATGDKFDCLYFSDQRRTIAIKMPHLDHFNNVGCGNKFCELEANSIEEAKEKLAKEIGPGSF